MSYIKKSVALALCDAIRRDNSGKWYSFAGLTCWYCLRSSKGKLADMRMRRKKGYQGCRLVNNWYARLSGSRARERMGKL